MRFAWVVLAGAIVAGRCFGQELPVLEAGAARRGEVVAGSPIVRTPALDAREGELPVRGVAHAIDVPAGAFTFELRAYLSDAYLVVRDAAGRVVAEDDDSLVCTHARAVVELAAPARLVVEACALHGELGPFELCARAGAPAPLDEAALGDLELEESLREIAAREAVLGTAHPSLFRLLRNTGYQRWRRREYAAALIDQRRALALLGEPPADPLVAAQVRSDVGSQLVGLGRHEEARAEYEAVRALRAELLGDDAAEVAATDVTLGRLALATGRAVDAAACFERATTIRLARFGPAALLTVTAATFAADAWDRAGRMRDALPLLDRVAAPLLAEAHPDRAALAALSVWMHRALADAGELERALATCLRLEELLAPPHEDATVRDAHARLGQRAAVLLHRLCRFDEAAQRFERIVAELESALPPGSPGSAEFARELRNLATVRSGQCRPVEAIELGERAAAIERALVPGSAEALADAIEVIAVACQQLGDYARARTLLREALALHERGASADDGARISILKNLAFIERGLGDHATARELGRRALAAADQHYARDRFETLQIVRNLALNERQAGDHAAALAFADDALERARLAAGLRARGATDAELASLVGDLEESVRDRLDAARCAGGMAAVAARWDDVLELKGFAQRETARRSAARRGLEEPAARARAARLDELRSALSAVFSLQDRPHTEQELADLRRERQRLEHELTAALALPSGEPAVRAHDVSAALPPGLALVDLYDSLVLVPPEPRADRSVASEVLIGFQTFAWIARAGAPVVAVDLGDSRELAHAVAAVLEIEAGPRGAAPAAGAGAKDPARAAMDRLRALLWEPLAPHLDGASDLAICSDGALARLPFGIVRDADGRHLLERFRIVAVDDVTRFVRTAAPRSAGAGREPRSTPSLLVAGAIDYDVAARAGDGDAPEPVATRGSFARTWLPLSETRREIDGIARHHRLRHRGAARVELTEELATEEALRAELPRHAVVHLATHGYFLADGNRSLREAQEEEAGAGVAAIEGSLQRRLIEASFPSVLCGLVCAGANTPLDGGRNGLLTGEEIAGLDLSACDLAVLSACESGLGRLAASGQGAMSLARAFRDAGARTVISSLWRVRDDSTRELMLDFYDRLWNQGESKLDALRNAQLAMLRKNREKYGDTRPNTWGAFVLTGEGE